MGNRTKAEVAEWVFVAVAMAGLAGLLGLHLRSDRARLAAQEGLRLADQAKLIDDNLERQLGAVNNALVSLRADLPGFLGRKGGLPLLGERLDSMSRAMPGVRTLFVMDAEGRVIASNRAGLVGQDLGERAYFQLARKDNDPDILHVSSPIRNALGTYAIDLERSTTGPDGRFSGLIAATLDPEYFSTLLTSVNYAPDMWTSLAHGDGTLFLMVPEQHVPAGLQLGRQGALFTRHMESGQAATVFTGRILATGEQRMVARRTVRPAALPMDAPLVVAVTRRTDALFAPWRKDLETYAGGFGLVLVTACVGMFARHHRQRSLAEAEAIQEVLRREGERRMSLFFDRQIVGMAITSPEQGWVKVNDRLCRMLGYTEAELLGTTWAELTHPDDLPEDQALFDQLMAGTIDEYALEKRYVRKDGSILPVELAVGCVRRPEGGLDCVLALVADVSDRRKALASLRESELRFRTLFEAHGAVMLLVDPRDGLIVDGNPAAARFYGYAREDLCGMPIADLNTGSSGQLQAELVHAAKADINTLVFRHRLADGELRTVEVHASPMEIQGRTLLFSIVIDITERIQAERELALRQAELENLNRSLEERVAEGVAQLRAKDQILITQGRQAALGEMLGNIAHQWRQPLNALSMVLVNLREARHHGELGPEAFDGALDKAAALIQRMSMTINDFRDFFRPDKGRVSFSVLEQVRAAVGLLEAGFQARGIAFVIEAAGDVRLCGLPSEFSQVLVNLLVNSKQAIRDAGVAEGRITIGIEAVDGYGRIQVRDNGGGVPEQHLDRIFEPYFSTRAAGTGIGLYMSRQIVEQSLQGRILARNVDAGAEFTLLVPLEGARP